jgi:4-amino-4-deoxy-L-arabinose transferase-like glycosyltransferase
MSTRSALGVFVLFSLARAALAPAFGLLPQSAYYFTAYAEHPALSYYDHPPMIGWLLLLSSSLLGKGVLAVRGAVFLTTLGTQWALFTLARRLMGEEAASRALVLFTTGGVALLLSYIAVPDVPLLLFWTLALLALHRALFQDELHEERDGGAAPRRGAWLAAGLFMGAAFLSKYTALFLQGGLVLHLLLCREHRRRLATPWPWTALAVAHLVSLPVYLWNARHGWASFRYQLMGRAADSRFAPDDLLGFLASQAVILLPVAFGAFAWAAGRELVRFGRERSLPPRASFLFSFSAPLVATCLALSVVTWVKSNWPMPAYVTGLILAAGVVGRRAVRWHAATGAALLAAAAIQIVWYPVPVRSHDTWMGWRELAAEVEELAARHPEAFVFAADGYKTTAELRFYTDLPVYGMDVIGWNALQYGLEGHDLGALAGRDAFFLRSEPKLRPGDETECYLTRVRGYFRGVEELPPVEVRHRGEVVRLLRVFRAEGYLGPAPPGARGLPAVC